MFGGIGYPFSCCSCKVRQYLLVILLISGRIYDIVQRATVLPIPTSEMLAVPGGLLVFTLFFYFMYVYTRCYMLQVCLSHQHGVFSLMYVCIS